MKKFLGFGINSYPSTAENLSGCVNDVLDWGKIFQKFGFEIETFFNEEVITKNLIKCQPGDVLIIFYAGHGTNFKKEDGGLEECLFLFDGEISLLEINSIKNNYLKMGVSLVIIFDTSFSANVSKLQPAPSMKARFTEMPHSGIQLGDSEFPIDETQSIILTASGQGEYAYESYFKGRWNGQMTRAALDSLGENQTYGKFFHLLSEDSTFPKTQTSILRGNKNYIKSALFTPFAEKPITFKDKIKSFIKR